MVLVLYLDICGHVAHATDWLYGKGALPTGFAFDHSNHVARDHLALDLEVLSTRLWVALLGDARRPQN